MAGVNPPPRKRSGSQRDRGTGARRSGGDSGRRGGRDNVEERPTTKLDRTPRGANEPVGLTKARRTAGAPPRVRRTVDAPPPPDFPEDERPDLPKGIQRDIDRTLGKGPKGHDVSLALSMGSAAIDEDRVDIALPMLRWAKHEAPRIAPVREAFGVALYLNGDYAAALTELQAYRRLTGRVDQNHLIADCLRALDRSIDQVADAAEALVDDEEAPEDRRAEAVIVWAAALADASDVRSGRVVLRRFLERRRSSDAEHDLRVRYLAADLAEQENDVADLRRQLELIVAVDPSFLDAEQRLNTLDD